MSHAAGTWACAVCRMANHRAMPYCERCEAPKGTSKPQVQALTETDVMRAVFLDGEKTFAHHRAALRADEAAYLVLFRRLVRSQLALTSATRTRAGAAALMLGGPDLKALVLRELIPTMNVAEVLGLVRVLDAPRLRRQLQGKLAKVLSASKIKTGRARILRRRIAEQTELLQDGDFAVDQAGNPSGEAEERPAPDATSTAAKKEHKPVLVYGGSMSGSVAKVLKSWAAAIPPEELEFFLLSFGVGEGAFPVQPWRDLADKVHFSPEDFAVPYFLPVVYGTPAPEGSLVHQLDRLSGDVRQLRPLFAEYPQLANMYSYLRKRFPRLPFKAVREIVARAPLEDVFWFYEEIMRRHVAKLPRGAVKEGVLEGIVDQRLQAGKEVDVRGRGRGNYGKLLQALVNLEKRRVCFLPALMTTCERELGRLKDKYGERDASIAVLGDCSGSMEVAVETATIVGSLLSSVLRAELVFFNNELRVPDRQPRAVEDVLHITKQIRAEKRTAPAAALAKYYTTKRVVDLFVVVSDEVENATVRIPWETTAKVKARGGKKGGAASRTTKDVYFAELFELYRREVNPDARIFFVTFMDAPITQKGRMRAALDRRGIASREFRMALRMPDLAKLPQILAHLSLDEACGADETPETSSSEGGEGAKPMTTGEEGEAEEDEAKVEEAETTKVAIAEANGPKASVPKDVRASVPPTVAEAVDVPETGLDAGDSTSTAPAEMEQLVSALVSALAKQDVSVEADEDEDDEWTVVG